MGETDLQRAKMNLKISSPEKNIENLLTVNILPPLKPPFYFPKLQARSPFFKIDFFPTFFIQIFYAFSTPRSQ